MGNFRLGNAWHIPGNPEPRRLPRGIEGMRNPVFPTLPVRAVTIFSGNQFMGGGNQGNQLQDGSSVSFKRSVDTGWTSLPMTFRAADVNNKYYSADIPVDTLEAGDVVQYYLTIAYDDHDTTFLTASADGMTSIPTGDEDQAKAAPFTVTINTRDKRGNWDDVFDLPNAAIHTHVLPNGLVLMWGRRDKPDQSLDVDPRSPLGPGQQPAPAAECTPFLWDPSTKTVKNTSKPTGQDGKPVNLFCSGHTFLADGRLFVVGGHMADGAGLDQATIYEPATKTWTPQKVMKHGRWYPTASALPDGSVLVVSGSYLDPQTRQTIPNIIPEVWKTDSDSGWRELGQSQDPGVTGNPNVDLYPRVHLASDGKVYLTGAQPEAWALEVSKEQPWSRVAERKMGSRDYAPSVMYEVDENSSKAIYIGGGNPPTQDIEHIDLVQKPAPFWKATSDGVQHMTHPRRQHNATILPDGTVLVTGGTRGPGFDAVDSGQPVHIAELWHPPTGDDPTTGMWTELAAEQIDRCYHSTAVLLPDATVLSAGGGEYYLDENTAQQRQNDPQDTHRDAQIFRPPYLFKGVAQPEITSAPEFVNYEETFEVETGQPDEIERVTWVRLSSVTHSFNTNQRFIELKHEIVGGNLRISAPTSANLCPPGHYMLFILNRQGVPSVARIMQMKVPTGARGVQARRLSQPPPGAKSVDAVELRQKVRNAPKEPMLSSGSPGHVPTE
jgi:galactose oxidase